MHICIYNNAISLAFIIKYGELPINKQKTDILGQTGWFCHAISYRHMGANLAHLSLDGY